MSPTPTEEPNPSPVTQLISRSVQLASNANPPTQEVFFKQTSQMMSNMMNSFFSQMDNYYQMKAPTVNIQSFFVHLLCLQGSGSDYLDCLVC
ncbi:hypothetical protein AVEN_185772-1 [Araneus ventricosus]|uniref:Uncharacterized protein n=1 Tax=Araneus ventricosus TaxID=182803 RepID=A0A4Y2HIN5_ARAVE|nr:hypothetical protein AVEN_185772-1 [Araneus ventricosus]